MAFKRREGETYSTDAVGHSEQPDTRPAVDKTVENPMTAHRPIRPIDLIAFVSMARMPKARLAVRDRRCLPFRRRQIIIRKAIRMVDRFMVARISLRIK